MAGEGLRRIRQRVSRSLLREELDRQQDALARKIDEVERVTAERIGELGAELRFLHEAVEHLEGVLLRPPWANLIGGPLRKLDSYSAAFLNYATGEHGYAAQAGVRFPPPVALVHGETAVTVGDISPEVVEAPFAITALAALPDGASVLAVRPRGSTLPLSLAAIGYRVTVLDGAGYPLTHPGLTVVPAEVEAWEPGGAAFDALVALSALEHVGMREFQEQPDADLLAMGKLRDAARPGAVLLLSLPLGDPKAQWGSRLYDEARLQRLLDGWDVEARLDVSPSPESRALIRARRP